MGNKKEGYIKILKKFVEVYCHKKHGTRRGELCVECDELLSYARGRVESCKLDPKPSCRKCKVHCFKSEYRKKIREVMRFSGMYYVKRGRIDWLIKHFWM